MSNYDEAVTWYEKLLGAPPSFLPNETEAVWEVAEHRYLYIVLRPKDAGHAVHTLFVDDFDTRLAEMSERGLDAAEQRRTRTACARPRTLTRTATRSGFGGAPL